MNFFNTEGVKLTIVFFQVISQLLSDSLIPFVALDVRR